MWRNKLIGLLFLLCGFYAAPANAACAGGTCFGIAAGNWNTSGTWSVLSGGVSCACTPATGDAIVLDASSGAGNYVINTGFSILTLVATGFTGTLTHNTAVTLTVTGNTFTLDAGMAAYTANATTSTIAFTATSGTTALTSAGKTLGSVTVNGAGGTVQLQDALLLRTDGVLTLTSGTFTANNFAVTAGAFVGTGATTRVLTMGTATWTMVNNGASTANSFSVADTGLTCSCNLGTLTFTATTASARSFTAGAQTYGTVNFSANTSGGSMTASSTNSGTATFGVVTITAPNNILVGSGATSNTIVMTSLSASGSSGSEIGLVGGGTAPSISIAAGSPTFTWAAIRLLTFTGGATFTATSSFDLGGNTGITITAPASGGGGGGKIIGGWLFDNDNNPAFLNQAA